MKREDMWLVVLIFVIVLSGFVLGLGFFTNWEFKSLLTSFVVNSENIEVVFKNSSLEGVKREILFLSNFN